MQAALEAAGILGLFDAVVTVEDIERGKPAPDLYLVALDRFQVAAPDCVAYEDTDEGLAAAKAAQDPLHRRAHRPGNRSRPDRRSRTWHGMSTQPGGVEATLTAAGHRPVASVRAAEFGQDAGLIEAADLARI